MKAHPVVLAIGCALFVESRAAALSEPVACSTSNLLVNSSPIANGTDGRCSAPPGTATSQRSVGFQDSSGPGHGNQAASGGIRIGAFGGGTHVSLSQVGALETSFAAQAIGQIFDGLTVHDAALDGTAGTLEVPVRVAGNFSGSSSNVPTAAPALPPTISGSFQFVCNGQTFAGGCGNQTVSFDVTDGGPASQPLDATFTMTMPIVFGQLLIYNATFTLTTGLLGTHCFNCTVETTMSGNADAGAAGTFGAALVRDSHGDAVAGATITSDSGYDYTVAPEPEELGLAALGCLAMLGQGSRRGRRGALRPSP
jgi:hypothetical protein